MRAFSNKTKLYLIGTMLLGAVFLGWNLYVLDTGQFWWLLGLSVLGSFSLILKVEGATERSHYNISFLVYAFTLILLGLPAAILVITVSHLVEWAWHKYPWFIQLFNLTSYIVVMEAAGLMYGWINPGWSIAGPEGILAVLAAMLLFTFLNHLMVGGILWLARGENFKKSGIFDFFPLLLDFILLSLGAGTALVWRINPFGIVLILMPLYLIYITLRVPALERKSETDAKTGLFNAKYFSRALESELSRANRFDRPMTVIMADLDLLRNINNTYGHLAGDEVLVGVAKILRESVRDYDVVARFGGEEFSILVPESSPRETYERVELIRKTIESARFPIPTSVTPIQITMSFGVAGREGSNQSPKDIIHNADIALYHAKLTGRNRTSIYNESAYDDLAEEQASGNAVPQAQSLEARIKLCEFPYQANPLREGPPNGSVPAVEVESAPAAGASPQSPKEIGQDEQEAPEEVRVSGKFLLPFIGCAMLVALGMLALLLRPILGPPILGHPPLPVDWAGLAIFTVIVVLVEWLSIDIYVQDTSVSTSAAPILAGTLLFGPVGSAVVSIAFAAVALVKHRSPVSRLIFNASNQMIAGLLYLGIIQLAAAPFAEWSIPIQIILCLMAAGITFLSTTFLITGAIHLDMGAPLRQVWVEKFSWLAPYYLTMGLIAYALIFSYRIEGVIGTAIILVPLFFLRFSQVQYIDRTRLVVKELGEKTLALENNVRQINSLNDDLFGILANAVDLRDPFVKKHSDQVSRYAGLLSRKLGLHEKQVELITRAGLLHDVGKLGIPDSILNKPSALTEDEYAAIKKHPIMGAELLKNFHALHGMMSIVRHHHERFDGKGYPDGLAGHQIPLEARIVCVADSVEAMASDRPYRRARTLEEIKTELRECSGAQFDPDVAKAFIELIESSPEDFLVNSARKWIADRPEQDGAHSLTNLAAYLFGD